MEEEKAYLASLRDIREYKRMPAEPEQTRQPELRMKAVVLSKVSHELRSPLSVIHQFTTVLATDGYMGTKMAIDEKPDLIILDIGPPMGDGFIVMDRLKDFIRRQMTPVIILSARDPEANEDRAMEAGAFAFFQKPADNDALPATIKKALEV